MAKIGKNILDNLTTGMYSDSKMIYREYIQNACDQIDKAVSINILEDAQQGQVDISIRPQAKYIRISDNATGVKAEDFQSSLGDIANSDKVRGKDRGFRGIGRLCGLAYCEELRFSTSFKGEETKSIMSCNGRLMREMLDAPEKYTVDEIWDKIIKFTIEKEDAEKHYFDVELLNVEDTAKELLDSNAIRDYLGFIAPVPYSNKFFFREKIYRYAKEHNHRVEEYRIYINGKQLFKEYTSNLKRLSGNKPKPYDEIKDLAFHELKDIRGNLLAWMWIGVSRFEKSIPSINKMRGIRIRSANIEVGESDILGKHNMFKEARGNNYFVGEIFTANAGLIPNSQRDYFNQNETRLAFEGALRRYCFENLHAYYSKANRILNAYKHEDEYERLEKEFEKKKSESGFIDRNEQQQEEEKLEKAREQLEKERKWMNSFREQPNDSVMKRIHDNIASKFKSPNNDCSNDKKETLSSKNTSKRKLKSQPLEKPSKVFFTSTLSKLSRKEQKLMSKVLAIISEVAGEETTKTIKERMKEEFS